jgi:hypothetical protein
MAAVCVTAFHMTVSSTDTCSPLSHCFLQFFIDASLSSCECDIDCQIICVLVATNTVVRVSSIATAVYEVTDEDLSYQEHLSSKSEILEVLHSKISTLLYPRIQKVLVTFLCSYYDSLTLENGLYDVVAVKVPREFAYVKELLNIEGDLRTIRCSRLVVGWSSMGSIGRTRELMSVI